MAWKKEVEYRKELVENALFDFFVALEGRNWDNYNDEDYEKASREIVDIAIKKWYNVNRKRGNQA